jgi:small conductance mechanosensitive channel
MTEEINPRPDDDGEEQQGRSRVPRMSPAALRQQAVVAARKSKRQLLILVPLVAAVVAAFVYREQLFGVDTPVRIGLAAAFAILSWSLAKNIGQVLQPRFERRLEPGTSGVVGFLVRLVSVAIAVLVSLRLAGLQPSTLVAGAGFTAIVVGLAAQQTFGNIFAGIVLASARPFRVGDRVRFNGFGMDVEGTVASQGLLYVTMHDGDDLVMVPNNTALTMSARPIREPASVDMRARMPLGVDPEAVQKRVSEAIGVSTRGSPHVLLEEFDGEDVIVRVKATPEWHQDGGRLAREVLGAVAGFSHRDGAADA